MNKRLLLGLTGSVAATLAPKLAQALVDAGFELKIAITQKTSSFLDLQTIPPGLRMGQDYGKILTAKNGIKVSVYTDADEWPERKYKKNDIITHVNLRDWADGLLIAPLSANTLAKMANGLCDNLLTNIVRAWDPAKPVIIAPAMDTLTWKNPLTSLHIGLLRNFFRLTLIPPVKKVLAGGQEGDGALADIGDITKMTKNSLGVRS